MKNRKHIVRVCLAAAFLAGGGCTWPTKRPAAAAGFSVYPPPEPAVFPQNEAAAVLPMDQIIPPGDAEEQEAPPPIRQIGIASWYVHVTRRTASGERYDRADYTAAHRTLPFGARVRVRNTTNGESVMVRINDRGPFVRGRIIDLSEAAAKKIGMVSPGLAPVEIEVVSLP